MLKDGLPTGRAYTWTSELGGAASDQPLSRKGALCQESLLLVCCADEKGGRLSELQ